MNEALSCTEEDVAALRGQIEEIQGAVQELLDSGMRYKTVLILLNHHTKIGQRTIDRVLQGVFTLEEEYFEERDDE